MAILLSSVPSLHEPNCNSWCASNPSTSTSTDCFAASSCRRLSTHATGMFDAWMKDMISAARSHAWWEVRKEPLIIRALDFGEEPHYWRVLCLRIQFSIEWRKCGGWRERRRADIALWRCKVWLGEGRMDLAVKVSSCECWIRRRERVVWRCREEDRAWCCNSIRLTSSRAEEFGHWWSASICLMSRIFEELWDCWSVNNRLISRRVCAYRAVRPVQRRRIACLFALCMKRWRLGCRCNGAEQGG